MSNLPVIAGFHACNNHAPTGKDRDIIRMTEAGAVTFLTGMGQRFSADDVRWCLSINPNCHFFLREYLDPNRIGDRHDRSTWNYNIIEEYITECSQTIAKYIHVIPEGQLHFQLFNEQNMPTWAQWEGFGDTPDDMRHFNYWFVRCVTLLRSAYPSVKFGLTPLTPGNRDVWFEGDPWSAHYYLHGPEAACFNASLAKVRAAKGSCLCKEAIEIADEYYFHTYVHEIRDPAGRGIPVFHPAYGLRYLRSLWFLSRKPYWILECGYPNESMWVTDARLLDWFKLLDSHSAERRPDGVTFWILGEKEDWGNIFSPGGVIRPFVYDLKKYLNEREVVTPIPPAPEPEPAPTEIIIHEQQHGYDSKTFKLYLFKTMPFAEIKEVFIHHTVNPTPATWRGRESILAMKHVYEKKGWTAGPHIFVAPDGIWVFTPINKQGIGCVGHNDHAIHVEIVGNYEENKLEGVMLRNTIDAFREICLWLDYDPLKLCFHRDYANTECPGMYIAATGFTFLYKVLNSLLRHEAGKRVGTEVVRLNEDSAFHKRTQIKGLTSGAPLTNEFEVCGYVVQGFSFSILRAKKGNWRYIEAISW